MKMENITLDKRLTCIASLVREGVHLIDVGTDHGYLPVSLVKNGKIPSATACDIAKGPLEKALFGIKANGLEERVKAVLSDGLMSVDIPSPCDIVMAGMGGELIAKIIDADKRLQNGNISLILQPMTKAECLREYLSKHGFEITSESIACEKKIYRVLAAHYVGKVAHMTYPELLLGRAELASDRELYIRYALEKRDELLRICEGKKKASADISYEKEIITYIDSLI